jgi:uncharacterized protein (TIGR00251 family)
MGVADCLSPTLDGAVILAIEVQPGAQRQGIVGFNPWRNRLSVAVKAEAKQGQANQAVLHVMSQHLRCSSASVSIMAGERSRFKSVKVVDVDVQTLLERLNDAMEGAV